MRFWRITVAISIISALSCLKHNNPFDMNDPNYEPPEVSIDSSSVNSGDSTGQESIVITVSGNKPEVEIRWQLDSLAWSPWQEQGTFTVSGYDTGRHTITIEGWYGGGGEIIDTNISFVKVNTLSLTVDTSSQLDDSLVIISEGTLCTLQVSASATGTPRYYWYHDLTIIDSTSGNRLIVGPTTVKDTGSYFVVVSNKWGSDTSRAVLLRYRNAPPYVAVLLDMAVTQGGSRILSTATLQVKDNDNTPAQIVFTIVNYPLHGLLRKSGTPLTIGATFTQQDIDSGRIVYQHDKSNTMRDSLSFTISDSKGGTIAQTWLTIRVGLITTDECTLLAPGADINATIREVTRRRAQETFCLEPGEYQQQMIRVHGNPRILIR